MFSFSSGGYGGESQSGESLGNLETCRSRAAGGLTIEGRLETLTHQRIEVAGILVFTGCSEGRDTSDKSA